MSERDLRAEVHAWLLEHGPAQAKTIAVGVRARKAEVAAVLAQDGFSQAERPGGTHPQSEWWIASRRVPRVTEGSRAARLLSILSDGEWHSRGDILVRAGRSFLTNNAAAELRAAGHDVVYKPVRGYRLRVPRSLAAPGGREPQPPTPGAASEPTRDLAAV